MTSVSASTGEPHGNNLDAVRIGAAMLVLVGHSYALNGLHEPAYLTWAPLGPLGVFIFFGISGYLVMESWRRDPHLGRFLARRSLRIFPGLTVCILLSAFVFGPMFSSLSLTDYFKHPLPYAYLWNILLSPVFSLPGVFEKNVLPGAVNGSIWSLPTEFAMYIIVAAVGLLRGNRWAFVAVLATSALLALFWAFRTTNMLVIYGSDLRQFVLCGTFFWVGAVFREFGVPRWFTLSSTVMAMLLLFALQPWIPVVRVAAWFLLPAIVLAFGLSRSPALIRLTRSGDYSYGVYIYAFPVQQAIAERWPGMPILPYILLVTAVVFVFAVLSWHLVEAPALRLKPRKPASR